MRGDLPSGTVTFLFTDVEGSTRLLHELGAEAYAQALAEHRRAIRESCAREGGVEVDTQGDAFFFAFPTAPGALAAAAAFTSALASGPIQVRVGLHTGTPLLTDEGYVGDDVHFAARVAAAAHGGQVVLSAATAKVGLSGSEPQALPVLDLGEHRLKDIADAVSIFQLGDGSFPPLKTISNTNLPRPASSFVGREAEVQAVLSRIEGGARLVTLTGPGGSGKTRLAIEAAATLVPEYKAGVFWVGLAALRDPALVTETIAQTLGAKDGLAEHVGERELLLLLDNLEQVIEAAPELAALVERCPNLTLLVTSRELLRVRGEVEYPVPPLAEPEAVELFCERAQLERSEEITELCARLDSLPLAVELAAARTKALSPAQILERLSQRLDLLQGGRDADPRQQTLRATIEWSYDLLTPEEQALFARLSVFAGGCTLEAAQEVADADLDALQSLVEKSLLRFTDERYWMLETIREYASERAQAAGELEDLAERHFEFFGRRAESLSGGLWNAEHEQTMQLFELDYPNFRAGLSWAGTAAEGRFLPRLAFPLADFWRASDHLREGSEWLGRAFELDVADTTELRVHALATASSVALLLGDTETALLRASRALELGRELGDLAGSAHALTRMAGVYASTGDEARAHALYEEAVAVAREARDDRTTAIALTGVAALELADRRWEAAETAYDEARGLFQRHGNRRGLALSLAGLADVAVGRGHRAEAVRLLRESAALYRVLGTKVWTARLLQNVAELELDGGDARRALRLVAAAQRLREDTGTSSRPHEQDAAESMIETLTGRLDASEAAALLDRGRSMSMSEALDDALSGLH